MPSFEQHFQSRTALKPQIFVNPNYLEWKARSSSSALGEESLARHARFIISFQRLLFSFTNIMLMKHCGDLSPKRKTCPLTQSFVGNYNNRNFIYPWFMLIKTVLFWQKASLYGMNQVYSKTSRGTEGQASDLFPNPSLSQVFGNIISEPEHKPLAWSRQTSSLSTCFNKFPSLIPSLIFV